MNKLFAFLMVMSCLLFAACDKDDVLPGEPMEWSYEILTPDNVKYTGGSVESTPRYCFKANSKEGCCDDLQQLRCARPSIRRAFHLRLWVGYAQGGGQQGENSFSSHRL